MKCLIYSLIMLVAAATATGVRAQAPAGIVGDAVISVLPPDTVRIETAVIEALRPDNSGPAQISIYELPYSVFTDSPDWHRLWVNTAVLMGAYTGTLFVLELLPEDATSWNRAALQKTPFYERWYNHVFRDGPEWDSDKPVFNYILHPYAGAAYFMAARSNGFNFYRSLLYSALISTVGWEFGIEACMERPSYQDIFITPLVGSAIGECFYRLKRNIVADDYRLFGSPVIGNIVAFLIDPVNEVVGLFGHNAARKVAARNASTPQFSSSFIPHVGGGTFGFSFSCTF